MKHKPETKRRSGCGRTAAIPALKQNDTSDRGAVNHISDLNLCENTLPDFLASFPELQLDLIPVDLKTMSVPELDAAEIDLASRLEKVEATKPAPRMQWFLFGIRSDRYGDAHPHVAALEGMEGVIVKKSRA
ncbi:MAG: hypothetical protein WAU58_18480 [Terriglobales bacterium]